MSNSIIYPIKNNRDNNFTLEMEDFNKDSSDSFIKVFLFIHQ